MTSALQVLFFLSCCWCALLNGLAGYMIFLEGPPRGDKLDEAAEVNRWLIGASLASTAITAGIAAVLR